MRWKYYGATGGGGEAIEIYRLPSDSIEKHFNFHHFEIMERLLPNGAWVRGHNARVEKDWIDGWFNHADEIDEAEVQRLVEKWDRERSWPKSPLQGV
jgi:hypothetical protein